MKYFKLPRHWVYFLAGIFVPSSSGDFQHSVIVTAGLYVFITICRWSLYGEDVDDPEKAAEHLSGD